MMRMPMLGVVVDGLLVYADAVRYRFYSTEQVGYKLFCHTTLNLIIL